MLKRLRLTSQSEYPAIKLSIEKFDSASVAGRCSASPGRTAGLQEQAGGPAHVTPVDDAEFVNQF